MKIIITGGSGFIGKKLVKGLIRENHDLTLLARNPDKIKLNSTKVKIIKFDISKENKKLLEGIELPDLLIHLAWHGLPNYEDSFNIKDNLSNEIRFLGTLISRGLKRILITGTCLEYGRNCNGELSENHPTKPDTAYAIAKDTLRHLLENLLLKEKGILQWARLFYIYGEGQREDSLFGQLEKAIKNKYETFPMSEATQLRDYLHIDKVIERLLYLVNNETINGAINICSQKPVKIKDLVNKRLKEKNSNLKIEFGKIEKRDYEPQSFWGHSEKLKEFF